MNAHHNLWYEYSMLKVELKDSELTPEQAVDADIAAYNEAFQSLGNDPLNRFERAAIKTYLAWKLGVMKVGEMAGGTPKDPAQSTQT